MVKRIGHEAESLLHEKPKLLMHRMQRKVDADDDALAFVFDPDFKEMLCAYKAYKRVCKDIGYGILSDLNEKLLNISLTLDNYIAMVKVEAEMLWEDMNSVVE